MERDPSLRTDSEKVVSYRKRFESAFTRTFDAPGRARSVAEAGFAPGFPLVFEETRAPEGRPRFPLVERDARPLRAQAFATNGAVQSETRAEQPERGASKTLDFEGFRSLLGPFLRAERLLRRTIQRAVSRG